MSRKWSESDVLDESELTRCELKQIAQLRFDVATICEGRGDFRANQISEPLSQAMHSNGDVAGGNSESLAETHVIAGRRRAHDERSQTLKLVGAQDTCLFDGQPIERSPHHALGPACVVERRWIGRTVARLLGEIAFTVLRIERHDLLALKTLLCAGDAPSVRKKQADALTQKTTEAAALLIGELQHVASE